MNELLKRYIENEYDSAGDWFLEEINKPYHKARIGRVIENKYYLSGKHKVMDREDAVFKGKVLVVRKTIIQYAKTILKFHATYMLGNRITLTGEQGVTNTFNEIYTNGDYVSVDYRILYNVLKFGDAYEYVYLDKEDNKIKSKVFDSADSYPVYDDEGNYIAFIEHWTDAYSNISYYNVFYLNRVEHYNNEGCELNHIGTSINISGLPIHYHNFSDEDTFYGESLLNDIKPLLDELEDIISKLGDAIYVNSLNPLNISIGQRIDSSVPADATGYVLNLEGGGDFKTVSPTMDYNNIKYYIESLRTMINEIACIPAVLSNSEVSNISEMSMKMLFHLASVMADDNKMWMQTGMKKRFLQWKELLKLQGVSCDGADDIDIRFNLSQPIADEQLVSNLKALQEMGAISKQTIMEKSGYIDDAEIEKQRIDNELKEIDNNVGSGEALDVAI